MEYELLSKIFYKKPTEYESIYDARFNSEASIKREFDTPFHN